MLCYPSTCDFVYASGYWHDATRPKPDIPAPRQYNHNSNRCHLQGGGVLPAMVRQAPMVSVEDRTSQAPRIVWPSQGYHQMDSWILHSDPLLLQNRAREVRNLIWRAVSARQYFVEQLSCSEERQDVVLLSRLVLGSRIQRMSFGARWGSDAKSRRPRSC
jgi:hypothetical protein